MGRTKDVRESGTQGGTQAGSARLAQKRKRTSNPQDEDSKRRKKNDTATRKKSIQTDVKMVKTESN